ncbi:hypothetical protein CW676_07795 [Macrococcoides caseolyticum]|uniref:hypothetical protein n=1 Tax=Macrococcoides caseolyticum TaxID=69966 RepID=UPI000C34794D|nr:hypothetical protein [Macrococcus caseolyticus]PKE06434.1 hypothetical protein CW692_08345 [Macrococcus caseolyticus]PKE23557.1 hypothetical protein CW689_08425 [Macrococcus caseolyticus]PKE52895.1 hypothetical protein CW676_07795 [Macrococcus caseolyticus]PKF37889.1 hypothetical protein CW681_09680 [Macrococcus caseolyticus]
MEMVLIEKQDIQFSVENEILDLSRSVIYKGNDILSTDIKFNEDLMNLFNFNLAIFNATKELKEYLNKNSINFRVESKFIIMENESTDLYRQLLSVLVNRSYNYIFSGIFILNHENSKPYFKNMKVYIDNEFAIIPYYEDESVYLLNGSKYIKNI